MRFNLGLIVLIIGTLAGCSRSKSRSGDQAISFSNLPWFPSLLAFENFDSSRSNLFSLAGYAGNFSGTNGVNTDVSGPDYPSISNMVYLDAINVFAYGGGYGDSAGSIGSYVAKIDPTTLDPIWFTQLVDTSANGDWDYPGAVALLRDGFLYVVYGYRLAKINPTDGAVMDTLILPNGSADPSDTAYNGFDATPDGLLVMRSIYRQAGCGIQGPSALTDCPDPSDVPSSVLVSVDPWTMTIKDSITLPSAVFGKITVGSYNDQNFVYLIGASTWLRYSIGAAGELSADGTWNPGSFFSPGQTPGSSLAIMNDWIVGQVNASPSATELSVFAIKQSDASTQFSIQPFLGDAIPPLVSAAFATAAPGGIQAVSWAPSGVSVDADTNMVYVTDALPGEIAAVSFDAIGGFSAEWKVNQTTTESIAIIGSEAERIVVATDIPSGEIPGSNTLSLVTWRNAAAGAEIGSTPPLLKITPQTMVQPYYSGEMFLAGVLGRITKLMPVAF